VGYCVESCSSGFYLRGGECLNCPESCAQCIGPGQFQCNECSIGYTMTPIKNCILCDNYYYENIYGQILCSLTCPRSYFESTYGRALICLPCLPNCGTCRNNSTCAQCVSGYYYVSGSCLSCIAYCEVCETSNTCKRCQLGYYLFNEACYN
jgi:proprotein convertase subtilisin/kexin type 5